MHRKALTLIALSVATAALLAGCSAEAPPPVTVAASEAEQQAATQAAQAAAELQTKYPGVEIPATTLVRFVSFTEKPHAVSECLNESGFETRVDMGGVRATIPTEQAQAYDVARYVCDVEYPLDPKFSEPLTDAQKGALYDYYVDTMAPCVEKLGLQVDEAPSREKFIEQYESGIWNPFNAITTASSNEVYDEAITKCPPYPDSLFGQ